MINAVCLVYCDGTILFNVVISHLTYWHNNAI